MPSGHYPPPDPTYVPAPVDDGSYDSVEASRAAAPDQSYVAPAVDQAQVPLGEQSYSPAAYVNPEGGALDTIGMGSAPGGVGPAPTAALDPSQTFAPTAQPPATPYAPGTYTPDAGGGNPLAAQPATTDIGAGAMSDYDLTNTAFDVSRSTLAPISNNVFSAPGSPAGGSMAQPQGSPLGMGQYVSVDRSNAAFDPARNMAAGTRDAQSRAAIERGGGRGYIVDNPPGTQAGSLENTFADIKDTVGGAIAAAGALKDQWDTPPWMNVHVPPQYSGGIATRINSTARNAESTAGNNYPAMSPGDAANMRLGEVQRNLRHAGDDLANGVNTAKAMVGWDVNPTLEPDLEANPVISGDGGYGRGYAPTGQTLRTSGAKVGGDYSPTGLSVPPNPQIDHAAIMAALRANVPGIGDPVITGGTQAFPSGSVLEQRPRPATPVIEGPFFSDAAQNLGQPQATTGRMGAATSQGRRTGAYNTSADNAGGGTPGEAAARAKMAAKTAPTAAEQEAGVRWQPGQPTLDWMQPIVQAAQRLDENTPAYGRGKSGQSGQSAAPASAVATSPTQNAQPRGAPPTMRAHQQGMDQTIIDVIGQVPTADGSLDPLTYVKTNGQIVGIRDPVDGTFHNWTELDAKGKDQLVLQMRAKIGAAPVEEKAAATLDGTTNTGSGGGGGTGSGKSAKGYTDENGVWHWYDDWSTKKTSSSKSYGGGGYSKSYGGGGGRSYDSGGGYSGRSSGRSSGGRSASSDFGRMMSEKDFLRDFDGDGKITMKDRKQARMLAMQANKKRGKTRGSTSSSVFPGKSGQRFPLNREDSQLRQQILQILSEELPGGLPSQSLPGGKGKKRAA